MAGAELETTLRETLPLTTNCMASAGLMHDVRQVGQHDARRDLRGLALTLAVCCQAEIQTHDLRSRLTLFLKVFGGTGRAANVWEELGHRAAVIDF